MDRTINGGIGHNIPGLNLVPNSFTRFVKVEPLAGWAFQTKRMQGKGFLLVNASGRNGDWVGLARLFVVVFAGTRGQGLRIAQFRERVQRDRKAIDSHRTQS